MGTWTIRLTAPAKGPDVRWHAWLAWSANRKGLVKLGPRGVLSRASTATIPAAANGIISVGSFVTKDSSGTASGPNGPISDISARGPTPDNTPLSPTITMPTLTAPGQYISTAFPPEDKRCARLASGADRTLRTRERHQFRDASRDRSSRIDAGESTCTNSGPDRDCPPKLSDTGHVNGQKHLGLWTAERDGRHRRSELNSRASYSV